MPLLRLFFFFFCVCLLGIVDHAPVFLQRSEGVVRHLVSFFSEAPEGQGIWLSCSPCCPTRPLSYSHTVTSHLARPCPASRFISQVPVRVKEPMAYLF